MNKKVVIISIIVVVLILLIISATLVYKKYIKNASKENEVITPPFVYSNSNSNPSYSNAAFPLKKGMSGSLIVELQDSINKKCKANLVTDGKFGDKTEAALKSCYGSTQASQALYTQMKLDGSGTTSPVSTNGFNPNDKVYLKGAVANIYSYPDFSSTYIVGSIEKSFFTDKAIGTYLSPAANGSVKIRVYGYKPYGKTNYVVETRDVYISILSIQKTPF